MFVQVILPLKLPFEPTYKSSLPLRPGDYVKVPLGSKTYIGVVSGVVDDCPQTVKPVTEAVSDIPSETASTIAFWRALAEYYMCTVGEVFKCARPVGRLEDALKDAARKEREKGDAYLKLQIRQSKLYDRLSTLDMRAFKKQQQLEKARESTRERYASELAVIRKQMKAVQDEIDALRPGGGDAPAVAGTLALELKEFSGSAADSVRPFLFPGKPAVWQGASMETRTVTFAELANGRLQEGLSTLILLPETYRTKRMQEALKAYIPEILVCDGKSTTAQVRKVLERIRDGRPYVLVGSRSAVLLPHSGLGLVIVDDEHDVSYKQDSPAPRYNARDAAVLLSGKDVPVLLASPFPSLETQLNVRCGKYARVSYEADWKRCFVVDTVKEAWKRGMADILSRKLIQEANIAVQSGRQVVLMVPRKAYSPLLKCSGCGELVTCPDCGGYVSLEQTVHGFVKRCSQCGRTDAFTEACPKCGSELKPVGSGLGRCEELVRSYYPSLSVAVIDGDMTEREIGGILDRFASGEIDILVGTQVVQKAFRCDNIGCVGVLDVDRWFSGHDFRADERAVQMFRRLQDMLTGDGVLVLQTRDASRPALREMDTEGYYLTEEDMEKTPVPIADMLLDERRVAAYPPYTRLLDIRVTDGNARRRNLLAGELAGKLHEFGMSLTGPFQMPGEDNRTHIDVFLRRDKSLQEMKRAVKSLVDRFAYERKYEGFVTMDVDPV